MKHEESDLQQSMIQWCELRKGKYPCLAFMHHSPNGGNRSAREGARFKREGVKAGFPDLFLPYASNGYNGLFVEVKTKNGRMRDNQKAWGEYLECNGYKFCVCRSLEEFIEIVEEYLR